MSERVARIARTTKETDIDLSVGLDGTGKTDVETGIGFFDHMLTAFGRHGLFDLQVRCKGDLEVDGHHSVEDTGIVMGQAFAQALGDKRGIRRFGDIAMPMDEALIMAAVDISGRGQLYWDADVPAVMVGAFDATLARSSSSPSPPTPASRCTSASLPARTPTTSSRACSRRWRVPCARPASPTPACATRCRPRRGCYKPGGACLTAVGPLDVAGGCGELLSPPFKLRSGAHCLH